MHLETLTIWLTTHLRRKPFSHFYSKDQLLSGPRKTSRTLLNGRMSEQFSLLNFQMYETNFGTDWNRNIVSEWMDKKFGTFYTVSKGGLTLAIRMIRMVFRPPNRMQNEMLKHDKKDKDTSATC